MERFIAYLLRTGVLVSAGIVSIGGVWYLAGNGGTRPEYASFLSEPSELRSPEATLVEAERFDSKAVIMTGLLVLIATPILRVAFTVFAFAVERDWIYVGMAALVLCVLLWSISGVE